MRRLLLLAVITATALPTLVSATSKSYDVTPYANCVAEISVSNGNVTQFYRNTLDSLVTASVWVGDTLSSQPYVVYVYDSITGLPVAEGPQGGVHAPKCWAWLNIPLTKDAEPVRGRTYKVVVTRSLGGGISFAYDPNNPYKYGHISVRSANPQPDTLASDLALRVIGLHDKVDSAAWGATSFIPYWSGSEPDTMRGKWGDSMRSSGAKWGTFYVNWHECEPKVDSYWFNDVDAHVRYIVDSACMEPVAVLIGTPKWFSTRIDSHWVIGEDSSYYCHDTSVFAAPRGLIANDTAPNYFAMYLDSLLHHHDQWWLDTHPGDTLRQFSRVHTWSIWNESNEGATDWGKRGTLPIFPAAVKARLKSTSIGPENSRYGPAVKPRAAAVVRFGERVGGRAVSRACQRACQCA